VLVTGAGLVWMGPGPEAIRRLGDKVEARRIAEAVGAPLVPGSDGPVADAEAAAAFAEYGTSREALRGLRSRGGSEKGHPVEKAKRRRREHTQEQPFLLGVGPLPFPRVI
jgi:acetyl/propionyl-CoA carboxylase alpha subunit